jgi:biotin transport system substrate-specific component
VGAVGLPVFAGGLGGIGRFAGPTGGYLIGYLPTVFLIGKMAQTDPPRVSTDVLAMICGTLVLYVCGVGWLKIVSGMPLGKTLALGMYPFLIGDAIKIAAAAAIARALRPVLRMENSGTH